MSLLLDVLFTVFTTAAGIALTLAFLAAIFIAAERMEGCPPSCAEQNTGRSNMISARKPMTIDRNRMELRRGFLDVHTPEKHLRELELPEDEQRNLIKGWIAELEAERKDLLRQIGKEGMSRAAANLSYRVNTLPHKRKLIRTSSHPDLMARDRILAAGKEMQLLMLLLKSMKQNNKPTSEQSK